MAPRIELEDYAREQLERLRRLSLLEPSDTALRIVIELTVPGERPPIADVTTRTDASLGPLPPSVMASSPSSEASHRVGYRLHKDGSSLYRASSVTSTSRARGFSPG